MINSQKCECVTHVGQRCECGGVVGGGRQDVLSAGENVEKM